MIPPQRAEHHRAPARIQTHKSNYRIQKKTPAHDRGPDLDFLQSVIEIEIEICSAIFTLPDEKAPLQRSRKGTRRLQWTDQVCDLVELIYSLSAQQSVNNGCTALKTLVAAFSELFHINLSNHANIFTAIRNRKGDRAAFLHTIYDTLNLKMEDMDK